MLLCPEPSTSRISIPPTRSRCAAQEYSDRCRRADRHRLNSVFARWHLASLCSNAKSLRMAGNFGRRRDGRALATVFRAWAALTRARRWRRQRRLSIALQCFAANAVGRCRRRKDLARAICWHDQRSPLVAASCGSWRFPRVACSQRRKLPPANGVPQAKVGSCSFPKSLASSGTQLVMWRWRAFVTLRRKTRRREVVAVKAIQGARLRAGLRGWRRWADERVRHSVARRRRHMRSAFVLLRQVGRLDVPQDTHRSLSEHFLSRVVCRRDIHRWQ